MKTELGYTQSPYFGNTMNTSELRGCFNRTGARVCFTDIRDGLTNTIVVGECLPAENDFIGNDFGGWCHADGHNNQGPATSKQRWPCFDGGSAHIGTCPPINFRTDVQGPCSQSADAAAHSWTNWNISWGFKSRHPGGAQFLFGDGAVHFLPEDINHDVYQLLGCRNDGRHVEEIP
jgi:prepilin-type processing-associated H-X9-DG protein